MRTSAIAKYRNEEGTRRFDIGSPLFGVTAIVAEFGASKVVDFSVGP